MQIELYSISYEDYKSAVLNALENGGNVTPESGVVRFFQPLQPLTDFLYRKFQIYNDLLTQDIDLANLLIRLTKGKIKNACIGTTADKGFYLSYCCD